MFERIGRAKQRDDQQHLGRGGGGGGTDRVTVSSPCRARRAVRFAANDVDDEVITHCPNGDNNDEL